MNAKTPRPAARPTLQRRPPKAIHRIDALHLLEDGEPHRLHLWKLATGDILTYPDAVFLSRQTRLGTHRVRLRTSRAVRMFRDVCLFRIDGMEIYF